MTVPVSRLYLPKLTTTNQNQKFPLLVYFHGGGFCISSPFTSKYHSYLNALVAEANVVAVSVNYRKAPEHPIPAANQDFWAALQWVVNHGPESWLNEHADFEKLFLSGDSAGANIAHNMAIVAGHPHPGPEPDLELGLKLNVPSLRVALVHPYFWGSDPIGCEAANPDAKASVDRLWLFLRPSNPDKDDPRLNPVAADAPSLVDLGCSRVLVCVAENDALKERFLIKNWAGVGGLGVVEIQETQGEDHGFHLYALGSERRRI